jgi:hypothetical protein
LEGEHHRGRRLREIEEMARYCRPNALNSFLSKPAAALPFQGLRVPAGRGTAGPSPPSSAASKDLRLRHQAHIVHKQRVNTSFAEGDDRIGGRADDWLAVIEGRINDDWHTGSSEKAGYKLVKARI